MNTDTTTSTETDAVTDKDTGTSTDTATDTDSTDTDSTGTDTDIMDTLMPSVSLTLNQRDDGERTTTTTITTDSCLTIRTKEIENRQTFQNSKGGDNKNIEVKRVKRMLITRRNGKFVLASASPSASRLKVNTRKNQPFVKKKPKTARRMKHTDDKFSYFLGGGDVMADAPTIDFAELNAKLLNEPKKTSEFENRGKDIASVLSDELRKLQSHKSPPNTRLYDYQIEAVLKTALFFKNAREPHQMALIVAPPGSGKSGMVALLPYVLNSHKVLILTPSKIISEQLATEFGHGSPQKPFIHKVGIILKLSACYTVLEPVHLARSTREVIEIMTNSNLVIVNAQKFGGNSACSLTSQRANVEDKQLTLDRLDQFDTIIVDEAHHYPAATWETIVNAFKGKKVVFLTATPYRGTDEKALTLFGALKIVYEISRNRLEGVTIRPMEFIEKHVDSVNLNDPTFLDQVHQDVKDILKKHYRQEHRVEHPQAMILVATKAEAKAVATGLGLTATFIIADNQMEKNMAAFTKKEKTIAVVCGMLREGYDNSSVTLVVFLRKCKSSVLFEQFCGRCIRMHRSLTGKNPDKTVATVMSYTHFGQRKMWEARERRADMDPEDEDDE